MEAVGEEGLDVNDLAYEAMYDTNAPIGAVQQFALSADLCQSMMYSDNAALLQEVDDLANCWFCYSLYDQQILLLFFKSRFISSIHSITRGIRRLMFCKSQEDPLSFLIEGVLYARAASC